MTDHLVALKIIDEKGYVDVDASVNAIKEELKKHESILIVARGIQISRVALVIKRAEEECNCTIAKMETKNIIEEHEGKSKKVLEFQTKLLKKK